MTAPAAPTQLALQAPEATLAINRASAAARRGDLDEAARLLTALGTPESAALDLLARIRAQQGDWSAADELWSRVQRFDPDHPGAADGRRVVGAILAGRRRRRPVASPGRVATAAGMLVVAFAGGLVAVSGNGTAETTQPTAVASPSTVDPALVRSRNRADTLQRQLAEIEAAEAAAARRLADQVAAISRALTMPGLIVTRRSGTVEVYFSEGLFVRDTQLTSDDAEPLTAVGRRLGELDCSITVVGHSVPVPGGRTSGGSATALARARFAAMRLASASGLPLTAFTLRTADQPDNPFKEDARNRTVSLVLTPAQAGGPPVG
ncbi:tetratricopeptide repeat protein [Micromonospora sp. LOL_023]|uniref:tetratricopeptide repeat protein n=1 Tax=Micromonospora sp. LOL_023 TaxID=3345418 RepID=UPI003A8C0FB1